MSAPLQRVLGDITRLPGVAAVFIVSKEGFVVDKASTGTLNIDDDAFAAMTTAVIGSIEQLGGELEIGRPEIVTLEFPGHYLLIHDLGDNIVALLADRGQAVLGRLRYELKKQAPRIQNLL